MSVTTNWPISALNPSVVGSAGVASGTSALFFPFPSGNLVTKNTAAPLKGQSTTPNNNSPAAGNYPLSAAGQLIVSGNNLLNGVPFIVSATGDFQVGAGGPYGKPDSEEQTKWNELYKKP